MVEVDAGGVEVTVTVTTGSVTVVVCTEVVAGGVTAWQRGAVVWVAVVVRVEPGAVVVVVFGRRYFEQA